MDRIFYDWYKDAKYILQPYQRNLARIGHLERLWELTQKLVEDSIGGGSGVQTVTGNAVDNTDPSNPIIDFPPSFGQNIGNKDLYIDEPVRILHLLNDGQLSFESDYIEQSFISDGDADLRSSLHTTLLKGTNTQTQSYLRLQNEVSAEPGAEYVDLEASMSTRHAQYFGNQVFSNFLSRVTDFDGRAVISTNSLETDGASLFGRFGSTLALGSDINLFVDYQSDVDSTLDKYAYYTLGSNYLDIIFSDNNGDISSFKIDPDGNINLSPFEKTVTDKDFQLNDDIYIINQGLTRYQADNDVFNSTGFVIDSNGVEIFTGIVKDNTQLLDYIYEDSDNYIIRSQIDTTIIDGGQKIVSLTLPTNDQETEIVIDSHLSNFSGILGTSDYSPYYVPNSFVQKSYVDVELISVDYGDFVNVTGRNTQVYTTTSGVGIVSVNLLASIPVGALLFVSDLGNDATNHNIIINSGLGSGILKGDGSPMAQTMVIDSSGFSFTLRKLTSTQWMVIGTNQ